jgi:ABC-2 type transport system ATP-binding protein|tara:strand:+ start:1086 stop:2066 length:981 start_codon:yes stop_codon:yes gene_type:complete
MAFSVKTDKSKLLSRIPTKAIESINLNKVYKNNKSQNKKTNALKNFNLTIARGSIFGILGPNGAGKSTFINILAGLTTKTSGVVKIWDIDIDKNHRQARTTIGVVPQELNIDPFFTPREILEIHAGLYGVGPRERKTKEILKLVGLSKEENSYTRALSGGMKRRLLIAKAMVHSPPILVLDEPTAGVDVKLRHQLWASIKKLSAQGITILLTTHYIEEAEKLCDTIAIVDHGKLICCDKTVNLISRLKNKKRIFIKIEGKVKKLPAKISSLLIERKNNGVLVFESSGKGANFEKILSAFKRSKIKISDLSTEEADLEDIFLKLTSS